MNGPAVGFVTVGVDNSPSALAAAQLAAAEAKVLKCDLVVAHAYQVPKHKPDLAGAAVMRFAELGETTLNRVLTELVVPPSVTVHTRLVQGSAAAMLRQAERSSRMVVVGSSAGPSGSASALGGLVSQVAAHASCPIVTVPRTWSSWAGGRLSPVLVTTVGHELDAVTADHAFEEAQARGAELVVLRVDEPDTSVLHREQGLALLQEQVHRFEQQYPDVPTRIETAIGDPQQVVIETTSRAALLVVGDARPVIGVPWLRPLARGVLSRSQCPVLLIPGYTRTPSGVPGSPSSPTTTRKM